VSGANVAIVVAGVLRPLRRRAVDRRVQAGVAGLALMGFVVLAGPGASVVRAAAMGAVTLLALASGRPRAALPALSAAVCVLLLLDPGLARDPASRSPSRRLPASSCSRRAGPAGCGSAAAGRCSPTRWP
jgi:competence protein ComEC